MPYPRDGHPPALMSLAEIEERCEFLPTGGFVKSILLGRVAALRSEVTMSCEGGVVRFVTPDGWDEARAVLAELVVEVVGALSAEFIEMRSPPARREVPRAAPTGCRAAEA